MLKKIFPIFFILCLVFSLTVPVFAQDIGRPVYYNQLAKNFSFSRYSASADCSVTYNSSSNTWDLFIGSSGYTNSIRYTLSSQFPRDHKILIIMHGTYIGNNTLILGFPSSSTTFAYDSVNSFFYCISKFNSDSSYFLMQSSSTFSATVSDLLFVDLDAIYENSSSVTISTFISDFPFFASDHVSYSLKSYYNPSVNDGFSKMLSFTHVFDRIPYFFDQYTTVTVWIVGSVSLSIVILVIVFMLKRFAGGKS